MLNPSKLSSETRPLKWIDQPMFSSVFSGKSNGSDFLKQWSTVIDLKAPFNGKIDSFFPFLDKLEDHLSMTGVIGKCKVWIPMFGGDENDYVFVNLFKIFGILKLQQIIDEWDQLKTSLTDEILLDPQGNAKHNDFIAQWQEQSLIYKGITKTLTDEVKAMVAPWRETIALDGIILLFVLI